MAEGDDGWEHFAHGADIGVRGRGATPAAAFEQAARALTAIVVEPDKVLPLLPVTVTCAAPDPEILLVDWLNSLIYEMAVRHLVFGRFSVRIDEGCTLRGSAWGERLDPVRHQPAVEPKGATMTGLRVARTDGGVWIAECVIDV